MTRSLLRCLLPVFAALAVGCAQLQPRPELPLDHAIPAGSGGQLDGLIAPVEARNPGKSGFRLLEEGPEAFVTRAETARLAARSVDVQTYIWHGDTTGLYLAAQLLSAADRGVRVRILVDDMDGRSGNVAFAALAAHENIDVRMFNPFASRKGTLAFLGEGARSFGRINHRMHNKSWIADNRIAVVGGRNLGDEYFGASDEVNFVDLDFAMVGPVVRDASASFDRYWNCGAAYPMEVLDPQGVNSAALGRVRAYLAKAASDAGVHRYTDKLRSDDTVRDLAAGRLPMQWSSNYSFASDDPLKALMDRNDPARSQVIATLAPALDAAREEILIISPYFVPGEVGTRAILGAVTNGRRVRILTNSLSANDVAAVHGGYSRYRKRLIEGGAEIWELKPLGGDEQQSSIFGSSGASLHTKAFVADRKTAFVGSYNLDPRSTLLNCEQGVLVEDEIITKELIDIFERQAAPERAWSVTGKNGGLIWTDGRETFESDPKASMGRKFQAWFARTFRLDAQL
jgi:putative cardiolipin synthase